jgi:hypothetical protein
LKRRLRIASSPVHPHAALQRHVLWKSDNHEAAIDPDLVIDTGEAVVSCRAIGCKKHAAELEYKAEAAGSRKSELAVQAKLDERQDLLKKGTPSCGSSDNGVV